MSSIAELLGVRYPVIQGAMGVISNPEMVAAVSVAGGYGLLASAFLQDPERLREQIRAVRELTDKPFGANLVAMNPMSMKFAEVLIEQGIGAVTSSAGHPGDLVSVLRPSNVKVIHVVPTVEAAVKAEEAGVDAVIAEGSESGGMQGRKGVSTMVLVPLVADAVSIPVIAAGGIGDSRGVKAALALGACGVQVGTRFIASRECVAHANYKKALCEGNETDTVLVDRGRVLVRATGTPLAKNLAGQGGGTSFNFSPEGLVKAWVGGDLDAHTLPAGQIMGMVGEVKGVREIIEEMVKGLEEAKR
jgi:enoyl-[acyl-carrier protein] reductase II